MLQFIDINKHHHHVYIAYHHFQEYYQFNDFDSMFCHLFENQCRSIKFATMTHVYYIWLMHVKRLIFTLNWFGHVWHYKVRSSAAHCLKCLRGHKRHLFLTENWISYARQIKKMSLKIPVSIWYEEHTHAAKQTLVAMLIILFEEILRIYLICMHKQCFQVNQQIIMLLK